MTVVIPPKAAGGGYGNNSPLYWQYSLDSRSTTVSGTMQFGGGITQANFSSTATFAEDGGLCYAADLNRYWLAWRNASEQTAFYSINPTTTPWTISPLTGIAGTAPANVIHPERKLVYMPALHAVAMCVNGSVEMYIVKLA
jgi:hypothetical protein